MRERGPSEGSSDPDPVVRAYLAGVDRTLIRKNLRLTPEERLRQLMQLHAFAEELARAGRKAREPHAVRMDLFGVPCLVLGLDKLIEVKRAAGRPKDLEALSELVAIRESRD
jgi:hypothetical protein